MWRLTFKSIWDHKRRLIGTCLAVILGIAFLTGTQVLGDTIRSTFGDLFSQVNENTDAVVRSSSKVEAGGDTQRAYIPQSFVEQVRGVDGVAAAEPNLRGLGQLVGKDGDTIGGLGPPTFAGNWVENGELNPYHLAEGRAPRRDNEVVIDQGSADDGGFRVGDRATVLVPQPIKVRIVGISTFGKLDNAGGATETDFTLPAAQRYLVGGRRQISEVVVAADKGVSQEELVRRLDKVLPASAEAITGEKLTNEQQDEIGKAFLDFFTTFLLVFAAIALIVATFSIYNTFTILVAQRTRESALLRAVGASRRQILQSVLAETFLVGLVSSVIGFFVGLLVATGLKAAFNRLGAELPTGGLVVKPATVITALIVGILVTIVAGVFPAVRASRVPPLAAMRDVAVESTALSKPRLGIGTALSIIGLGLVLQTAFTGSGEYVLERAGLGAFLLIVGVIILGPVVARPAAQILGAPVARFRGVTGRLARENAMRNPRRTAGTASALLFFITVVTLFTVFFASVKASIDASVNQSFGGDLVIGPESAFGGSGISPTAADQTAALPQVQTAVGVGGGQVEIDGHGTFATVADPAELGKIIDLDVQAGRLDRLGPDQMAVYTGTADDKDWTIGSRVPVRFVDGTTRPMRIGAIYDANDITGNDLLPRDTVASHTPQLRDFVVLVDLKPGVSLEDGRAAVERISDRYPGTKVQDRDQYTASIAQGINQVLGIIGVMLVLAVIIAIIGIANTLSLSVYERTRELGLLRAVGETRRQTRVMIRWEAILVSVFGTVGGIALGVFLGWAIVKAAGQDQGIATFAAPPQQLLIILFAGWLVGVIASIRPARRAAKLEILR